MGVSHACLSRPLPPLVRPRGRHIPRHALGLKVEQARPYALPYEAHSARVVRVEAPALHDLDRDLKRREGSVAALSAPSTKRCISPRNAPWRAGNCLGCASVTSQSGSNRRMGVVNVNGLAVHLDLPV
jgi:hypothetical protein